MRQRLTQAAAIAVVLATASCGLLSDDDRSPSNVDALEAARQSSAAARAAHSDWMTVTTTERQPDPQAWARQNSSGPGTITITDTTFTYAHTTTGCVFTWTGPKQTIACDGTAVDPAAVDASVPDLEAFTTQVGAVAESLDPLASSLGKQVTDLTAADVDAHLSPYATPGTSYTLTGDRLTVKAYPDCAAVIDLTNPRDPKVACG